MCHEEGRKEGREHAHVQPEPRPDARPSDMSRIHRGINQNISGRMGLKGLSRQSDRSLSVSLEWRQLFQFIFSRSFVAFSLHSALLLPSLLPPLFLLFYPSIHPSHTEQGPPLIFANGHWDRRVPGVDGCDGVETSLIRELAQNIGRMTAAPRGILLSLAPLYNSRHHHHQRRRSAR